MSEKSLEQQTIKNDFVFGAVMKDAKRCKPLLEYILGKKIKKISYPERQKVIDHTIDGKSIRLDVYVEDDENTVYDIEIQTTRKKNLPKRIRYYQGMIDLNIISKGEKYSALKKSFVIFICDYDPFGKGNHIYTFGKICKEDNSIVLGDEAEIIILNTKGVADDVSEDLKETLHYIGGESPKSEYTRDLERAVNEIKASEKWRREYMTLYLRDVENKEIGEYKKLVSQIRDINPDEISYAVKYLKVDESFVLNVLDIIKNNPDLSDEEIAEILADN